MPISAADRIHANSSQARLRMLNEFRIVRASIWVGSACEICGCDRCVRPIWFRGAPHDSLCLHVCFLMTFIVNESEHMCNLQKSTSTSGRPSLPPLLMVLMERCRKRQFIVRNTRVSLCVRCVLGPCFSSADGSGGLWMSATRGSWSTCTSLWTAACVSASAALPGSS